MQDQLLALQFLNLVGALLLPNRETLQQRGIPKKEAKALLMYAFANTVLESVKIPEVKERITKLIATKLNVNIGFNV